MVGQILRFSKGLIFPDQLLLFSLSVVFAFSCAKRTELPDEPLLVGSAPSITNITDQVSNEDEILNFQIQVEDVDSDFSCESGLQISIEPLGFIDDSSIVISTIESGLTSTCAIQFSPMPNIFGSTQVLFTATDSQSLTSETRLNWQINPINDAPVIANISDRILKTDQSLQIPIQVQDPDSSTLCATNITISSQNELVLPSSGLVLSGTAPNCILTVTNSLNIAGSSLITVDVSDGLATDQKQFQISTVAMNSIQVNPSSLSLAVGGATQLQLLANYSDGSQENRSAGADWSSDQPTRVSVDDVSNKGRIEGLSAGSATIQATLKGLSATSIVQAYVVTGIGVSRGAVTGGIGSQWIIQATAQTTTSSFDITASAVWTSSDAAVATVSNGVIRLLSAGSTVVRASYGSFSADVVVIVQNKSLTEIQITLEGGGDSLSINGSKRLIAMALYSDLSSEDVTNLVTWTSSNPSILSIDSAAPFQGRITGLSGGTSQVSAQLGVVSSQKLITVNLVSIVSISITPDDPLLVSNASYKLRATATYSDSSIADVTELVTWSSNNTLAATVSNLSGEKGLLTTPSFTGYRAAQISATLSGVTGVTPVGVNGASILSIVVTPSLELTIAQASQMKAYANLSDGGVIDVTDFSIWSSSDPSIASISNAVGSIGLVTGVSNGSTTISVSFAGQSGTRLVQVGSTSSLEDIGVGLRGRYYTWTSTPVYSEVNRKGSRIDSRINFAWGMGNAPMGVGERYLVRWTGFYKATDASNYFCTFSDDGIRVWMNGVQIINQWNDHAGRWDCSGLVSLTPGVLYPIVVEFYENGGFAEAHLTRSSVSAADAQSTSTRIVPQSSLFPD